MTSQPARRRSSCAAQRIEVPSWAFGNSGTRFKVFAQQGVPRDPYEKIADAAQVHRFTGVAPTVALHIPWDKVDDYAALARHATELGVAPRHDQLQHVPGRRLHARAASATPTRASGARPSTTCSSASTSWTRPGRATSSCGSPTAPTTPARTTSAPARTGWPRRSRRLRAARRRTSGWCWSTSSSSRRSTRPTCRTGARRTPTASPLGPKAKVVVDTGHHAPGTNIEFIVASLLRAGKLGALRLQLPLLRRRRPDGRRGRPVPAVPDHARGRPRRRARRRCRAWRSCSTSATTSSRRSPARSAR